MDEDIGARRNDSEAVEHGETGAEGIPEAEAAAREKLRRSMEKVRDVEDTGETDESYGASAGVDEAEAEEAPPWREAPPEVTEPIVAAAPEEGEEPSVKESTAAPSHEEDVTREARVVTPEARETADEMAWATRESIAATEERSMAPEFREISFGDGFRFGCGFTVASCLFWLVVGIVLAIIPVALSALNVVGLPGR